MEVSPINVAWSHFAVNNLRYRNADLSIVWDDPADGITRYAGVPQGYSIYLNGTRAATVNQLVPFTYNPATGAVSTSGTVAFSTAISGIQSPTQVVHTDARTVDIFAKAGADLTANLTNLAAGATASASFTGSGASTAGAIDGFPINEPFWGAGGSPNAQDWYEVNFGQTRAFDEVRLYFKDSRPASTTYRAPSSYNIQFLNGSTWTTVGGQVKSPAAPRANYNLVTFPAVSAQRVRVLATNASGAKTGLTEIKIFNRGGTQPPPPPPPSGNLALSATPSASYTSPWESVLAINDGIDPPSSNDTVNPRWGTWPNTGEQWALLTWPSAVTLNSADVYFFDDGQGIDLPASWRLQSWNGSAYVDVAGASGYPVVANQYNHVTFTGVSTTRLRVVLQSGTASVGLLEVKAFGGTPPPPPSNKALTATPSASYTSPWESVLALNDGIDPPSSNDTVNPRWGTWPNTGEQWGQLTWSSAQSLNRAEVYFFDDGGGIDLPASWRLQYWNGTAFADVPGASGYPVVANQYNNVTFTGVSTTQLRVVLQSGAASVGLLEVKALGP